MKVKIVLGIIDILFIDIYLLRMKINFKVLTLNYVMRMEIYLVEELKVEVIYI